MKGSFARQCSGADCKKGSEVLLSAGMQGVTLGAIQTLTAVSLLCLIRERENGINRGCDIIWVSSEACKDIGILQLRDKESLSEVKISFLPVKK